MEWFVGTLRHYPELAIFLTLGIGYSVGKLKLGKVTLGAVTGTLLVGLLVGQMNIVISANVKSVFFLLFLFAVGYSVGPQFFRGLKSDAMPQVIFAIILCLACLLSVYLVSLILGFNVGQAAGLLSGACTISAVIGVATDTINQLAFSAEQKKVFIDYIPVAYAVTYIFGTVGSAWFLASVGPKLLGVDLAAECRKLEEKMGAGKSEPGIISAYQQIVVRAYLVTNTKFANKTIKEFEQGFITDASSLRIFVERLRQGGRILEPEPSIIIREGDVLALGARRELLVQLENENALGPEMDDRELLDFPAESLDVVVTNKSIAGKTMKEIAESDAGKEEGRGVFLMKKLKRGAISMPVTLGTTVDRGDVLTIVGAKRDVERAAKALGYPDRATEMTDMVFVGIGILLGGLIGALSIKLGKVPLSLSTSGGVLIMGLIFGWLRSVHPTFGRIPGGALWMMNNMGLTAFIAVVGISSGPGFVEGIKAAGFLLFFAGVVVTTMPLLVGIFVGKYIFKMNAGIILGACAGARATTAALGAIQDVANSKVPALSYTVTYAVGNTLLIIWGVVIVMLMA
jgi:putative transport protein